MTCLNVFAEVRKAKILPYLGKRVAVLLNGSGKYIWFREHDTDFRRCNFRTSWNYGTVLNIHEDSVDFGYYVRDEPYVVFSCSFDAIQHIEGDRNG